ncbi:MAG: FtsQ-type POTRA domain-containing protein [Alphaproteobacteria bacterium]|nr:FtsQ-type POTRA domain-containing protein [Alphaproteobacteria bacterium]MCW5742309.1 FtsQ-type POTRA domain-containing protein [Alphaproteobacteria bacterium]
MPAVTTTPFGKDIDVRPRRGAARRPGAPRPGTARPSHGRKNARRRLPLRISWRSALILGVVVMTLGGGAIAGYALWKSGAVDDGKAWVERIANRVTGFAPFPLEDVTVEGRKHVTKDAVLKALNAARGDSLLTVDLHGARERLERIEWVEYAAVERRWPDTIHVALRERQAVALWQSTSVGTDGRSVTEYILIDRFGRRVRTVDPAESSVRLLLAGEGAPEQVAGLFLLLQDARPIADRLRAAVFVGQRRWNLILDGDLQIRLPEEGAGEALKRVLELDRSDQLLARDLSVIDLRLPDRITLRRAGAPDPLLSVGPRRESPPPSPPAATGGPARSPVARPPATPPAPNGKPRGVKPAGQKT